jgi:hypothetical protein
MDAASEIVLGLVRSTMPPIDPADLFAQQAQREQGLKRQL